MYEPMDTAIFPARSAETQAVVRISPFPCPRCGRRMRATDANVINDNKIVFDCGRCFHRVIEILRA